MKSQQQSEKKLKQINGSKNQISSSKAQLPVTNLRRSSLKKASMMLSREQQFAIRGMSEAELNPSKNPNREQNSMLLASNLHTLNHINSDNSLTDIKENQQQQQSGIKLPTIQNIRQSSGKKESQQQLPTRISSGTTQGVRSPSNNFHSNFQQQEDMASLQQKKQREQCIEILKNLNFALNPQLLKSKKIQQQRTVHWSEREKESNKSILQPSQLTRNVLEFRNRNKLPNSKSLQPKPKLKSGTFFKNGSITMVSNIQQQTRDYINVKNQGFTKIQLYKNDGEFTKDKNRMQFVHWLQENKQEIVQAFKLKQEEFIGTVSYVKDINKKEFDLILNYIGIKKDKSLYERIFWLFDMNNNKSIDAYEVEYALNIFRENSLEENIQLFFDIASDRNQIDGYINESELKQLFVKNLTQMNEVKVAKLILSQFYNSLSLREPLKGITKEELLVFCLTDQGMRQIVQKNTRILKSSKAEEYVTPQQYLICEQAIKNEGLYYAEDDNIYRAFREKESTFGISKEVKLDMNIIKKMNKEAGLFDLGEDSSNSDSEEEREKE